MHICVVPSNDRLNSLHAENVRAWLDPMGGAYRITGPADGLETADVIVHSAHEPWDPPPRRDMWVNAVVIDTLPYANGEHTDDWLTFYTNLFRAQFILCDAATRAGLAAVGLEWLQPRCVSIDGVASAWAHVRSMPLNRYTLVAIPTNRCAPEIKLRDALRAHVNADRKPPETKRTCAVEEGFADATPPALGICFNPLVSTTLAHNASCTLGFAVFPHSAYERIGAQLDCRQFHRNLDRMWTIASTAEGNAITQYTREALKTLLEEVAMVCTSFGKIPLQRPYSNHNIADVLFHAINIRGMR